MTIIKIKVPTFNYIEQDLEFPLYTVWHNRLCITYNRWEDTGRLISIIQESLDNYESFTLQTSYHPLDNEDGSYIPKLEDAKAEAEFFQALGRLKEFTFDVSKSLGEKEVKIIEEGDDEVGC